jgi:L-galactose dehydrogenase
MYQTTLQTKQNQWCMQRIDRRVRSLISRIGFGAAPFGGLYGEAAPADERRRIVREALLNGITFFDTSPYYNHSEKNLGEALSGVPRCTYALCTKAGRISNHHFDFSPAALDASLERSLERLQTDYVDVFLLHDVEFTGDRFEAEIMETAVPHIAQTARSTGKALAVGLSCLPLQTVHRALAHPNAALLDVVLTYSHNTLVDASLPALKALTDAKGITLIDASPLAMGLLTDAGPLPWHPAGQPLRDACRTMNDELRTNHGLRLQDVALSYALRNQVAPCTLLGCRTLHELRANVNVAAGESRSTPELEEMVHTQLAKHDAG